MLKYSQCILLLLPCFQRLFNFILNSGKYQKLWSHGLILPIYKSDNAQDSCYYRSIAITSCLAKLFNRLMNKRLTSFLTENGIICDEQIGFCHRSQTSNHIFKLKTLISKYLHNSKRLHVSFIDLRKAFDGVLHPAIFIKLVSCGLRGKFLSDLETMYSQIDLHVICNSLGLTDVFPSHLGVLLRRLLRSKPV